MNLLKQILIGIMMAKTSIATDTKIAFEDKEPPKVKKQPHTYTVHDQELQDDYAWIRSPEWKTPKDVVTDKDIIGLLEEENAYTELFYEPLKETVQQLFQERKGYIQEEDESVPIKRGDYYYYSRQTIKQNYPVYYRRKGGMDQEEEVLMDINKEAQNFSYYRVKGMAISPCHQMMAYTVDTSGNEFFELRIRDLAEKTDLKDCLKNVSSRIVWDLQSRGVYYLRCTEEWRTKQLYFHALGESSEKDMMLYEEKEEIPTLGLGQSKDKQYLFLESGTKEENEIFIMDLSEEKPSLKQLVEKKTKRQVQVEHRDGFFYYLVNDTGSNFRLVRQKVGTEKWEELIAHDKDVYLTGLAVYKNGVVVTTREKGLDFITILDEEQKKLQAVSMKDESYELSLYPTTYEDEDIRFTYSSLIQPESVMSVSFDLERLQTLKTQKIPTGFNGDDYACQRLWIKARDGIQVPISLSYHKGHFKKGEGNPLLLYGYGSYGIGMPAYFNFRTLSLMNHGFVFAIAHIRGGDDLGYDWYLDGKEFNKKNTFNDFIDCAKALVDQGYTKKGEIAAMGGSAGGMLMGAVANEAPELFKAIIAHVPFVDVINTMLDSTLPLTPGEFPEWGNPIEDKKVFEYMLSYSPYENVKKQDYPALLVTSGLTDPRVTYWEPTKWVAKLRGMNTNKNPILLRTNMSAGHGGGSSRDDALMEGAQDLAFLMKVFGKTN